MGVIGVDASSVLGARVIARVQVAHIGEFRRNATRMGAVVAGLGAAGAIGARIAAGKSKAIPAQTPKFERRFATLAATDQELALVSHHLGVTAKPGEVITRIPRADVVSAEVGKGVAPPLTITLADGEFWQFEICNPGILALVPAWNNRRCGRRVADLLNRTAAGV